MSFFPNCSSVARAGVRARATRQIEGAHAVDVGCRIAGCAPSKNHSQNESVGVINTANCGRSSTASKSAPSMAPEVVADVCKPVGSSFATSLKQI